LAGSGENQGHELNSKIQGISRHGKCLRNIKEPKGKKSKPNAEGHKNWIVWFWILEYLVFSEQIAYG
jgi:hypothetical protein